MEIIILIVVILIISGAVEQAIAKRKFEKAWEDWADTMESIYHDEDDQYEVYDTEITDINDKRNEQPEWFRDQACNTDHQTIPQRDWAAHWKTYHE